MKKFLCLFFLFLLIIAATIGCTNQVEPTPVAIAPSTTPTTTTQPTATITAVPPTVTPTSTLTPTPTTMPTPTIEPSSTPIPCPPANVITALNALEQLDTYSILIKTYPASLEDQPLMSFNMNIDNLRNVVEIFISSLEEQNDSHIIFINDRFYVQVGDQEWSVIEGLGAREALRSMIDEQQLMQPGMTEQLTNPECIGQEEIAGSATYHYRYEHVDWTNIQPSQQLPLDLAFDDVLVDVWINHEGESPLLIKYQFAVTYTPRAFITFDVTITDVNAPLEIVEPSDVEPPSFFISDLPLIENAVIVLESEYLIAYITSLTPENVLDFYAQELELSGWTFDYEDTLVTEEMTLTVHAYKKDNLELAVGVGEKDGATVVSIAGGEPQ